MIHTLLQGIPGNVEWHESFAQFGKQGQTSNWFHKAKLRIIRRRKRNEAISTIMPDQYISGDAIMFCLNAVNFKPPKETYVYDVLLSAATESQLWTSFWRSKRKNKERKIDKIILPINIHNIHWYLAIAQIGKNEVNLNIQNNIGMRKKTAEDKLLNIARKYSPKIITQKDQKDMETVGERQNTMETQPKEAAYDDFLQFYYAKKHHDKITTQINHKIEKIENRMSTIERNNSEYIQMSQNRERH